ncbi:MAG: RNA 2',3'-cyclic phosphodiesterase [Actinomycetota bacterium]|nr:RNA 2',3'-cyclic phosphodiesterase [Actinomycetota bacterium]
MKAPASVGGRDGHRLFTALVLPGDTTRRLVEWQRRAFAGVSEVRPVARENLHVTLAFLGHRPAHELDGIVDCLRAAAAAAERPVLMVARYRETRTVGMLALDDDGGRATALAEDLHGRLERLGVYEAERRRWLAHVTVLRYRHPPRLAPALPDLGRFSPSEAAVYHSVLRPTGAQYEILESVPVGG